MMVLEIKEMVSKEELGVCALLVLGDVGESLRDIEMIL